MSERDIFLAAVDLPDGERPAYLDRACGADADLRVRVDALLRSHDAAGSFLNGPAADPADAATVAFTSGPEGEEYDEVPLGFLDPPGRPDSLGRLGHYDVLEVLGRGGFGIVFRAFDDRLQRVVAVKVLSPQMATTSPARKRFLREARSSGAVRHENVVPVHAVEEHPLPHLVMDYIPGETLQQRIRRIGPLDLAEAVRVGRQIASGLAAAHATGLIHRDIKPSNILLDTGPHPTAKITDFGLARAADDASLTRSGTVAGTPMYMSPEQARGDTLDHRSDLFSLGSVLYALVTGRPPFRAETTLAVLKRVAEDTPRPIREVIPEVPEWFCRIVEKLHAKDPAERFQTAQEVADLLTDCERQLADGNKLTDYSRIPGGKPTGKPTRWKWAALAAAVLVALLVAVWATPPARRYVTDRGAIEFVPADGVEGLTVYRSDGTVWGEFDATRVQEIELPSGDYKLVAKVAPGREFIKWQVSESGFAEPSPGDEAGTPIFLADMARGDWFRLRATTRVAPPTAPAVPKTAAEFLPFVRGTWTRNAEVVEPKAEAGRVGGQFTFDPVAGGTLWRGLNVNEHAIPTSLVLHRYDPTSGRLSSWSFGPDGVAIASDFGTYEPTTRLFAWQEKLPDGGQSAHHLTVVDGNTVTARHYDTDATGKIAFESWGTFTRSALPPVVPKLVLDPKRPTEMTVLDRMVGEWRNEQTVTDPATPDKAKTETFRVTAKLILGGRFVEEQVTNDLAGEGDYTIAWFDPAAKVYRRWYFSGGPVTELTGTWDDTAKAMTWTSTDKATVAVETFKGDDRSEFRITVKDGDDKPVRETTGVARRVSPSAKPVATAQQLRDKVAAVQAARDLTKTRFDAETVSGVEMARADGDLADAKAELAAAEGDRAAAVALVGELRMRRQKERELVALRAKEGVEKPEVVLDAEVRLKAAWGRAAQLGLEPERPTAPFDEKQAKEHQERWAKQAGETPEFADRTLGMEFRVIPPGEFPMGSPAAVVNPEVARLKLNKPPGWETLVAGLEAEMPQHPVRITRPFAIGKNEVTVGQFRQFVTDPAGGYRPTGPVIGGHGVANGKLTEGKGYTWERPGYDPPDLAPVWNVSAEDAAAFCKWLSKKDGRTYRLPTEAEWEWACRAGTPGRTYFPFATIHQHAWAPASKEDCPQPVGLKTANPFGLNDINGNVWEWCSDWYGEGYYKTLPADTPTDDPTGPPAPGKGKTAHRVQRGGSIFRLGHVFTNSAVRPVVEQPGCGFRVVCELVPK